MELYNKIKNLQQNLEDSSNLLKTLEAKTAPNALENLAQNAAQNYLEKNMDAISKSESIQKIAESKIADFITTNAQNITSNLTNQAAQQIAQNATKTLEAQAQKQISANLEPIKKQIILNTSQNLKSELTQSAAQEILNTLKENLPAEAIKQEVITKSAQEITNAAEEIAQNAAKEQIDKSISEQIQATLSPTLRAHLDSKLSDETLQNFIIKNTQNLFDEFVKNNHDLLEHLEYRYKSQLIFSAQTLAKDLSFVSQVLSDFAQAKILEQRAANMPKDENTTITFKTYKIV